MGKEIDVVTLGYIFNERIQTISGSIVGPFLGATASYGSIGLARAGYSTGLVSNIGSQTPWSLIKTFTEAGVDLQGLNIYPGASETKDLLRYFEDGTKLIEYETRAPRIMPQDIPNSYLETMRVMMLALVDYEVDLSTIHYVKERRPNVIISADLGGVGGAHSTAPLRKKYIYNKGGAMQKEYLSLIDIGKMSFEDYVCMTGKIGTNYREAAEDMIAAGIKIVILTLGAEGSYILTAEGKEYWIAPIKTYEGVVDTTGAGDTYISVFTAEYVQTGDILKAGMFASATTSILIEKTGGVSLERCPDRAAIEARINRYLAEKKSNNGE